jgi:hypothetical protein
MLNHHGKEVLSNLNDAVKSKEEALQDNENKQKLIDELTVAVETKDVVNKT